MITITNVFMQILETQDLGGSSLMDMQYGAYFVHRGDVELTKLEDNLNWLTLDILYASIDDLLRRYQRHTIGVSGRFNRLLWRVARAMMCYHEHQQSFYMMYTLKAIQMQDFCHFVCLKARALQSRSRDHIFCKTLYIYTDLFMVFICV